MGEASPHILVLGSGSVGQRHAANLAALGCRISCADPREERVADLAGQVKVQSTYNDMDAALGDVGRYDGVAICSPTAFHVKQAKAALRASVPVLLEKPVAIGEAEARRLLELECSTSTPVLMGYTWRWWEPLQEVRRLLKSDATGPLRHVRFVMSAHLEDWHPWEPVTDFFMSNKALGGGALLDESHWLDLMLWFFGMPQTVWGRVETIGSLELETDDHVDALFDYTNGLRVALHLDLYGRPHEKSITFAGETGTVRWTAEPNQISVATGMSQDWEVTSFDCERNDMFVGVAQSFLDVLKGGQPEHGLRDGVKVMRVIEALRKSSKQGRVVELSKEVD